MSEGDALEGNDMFHAAPDSNTAVMEAPAPIAAGTEIHPDSSAAPVSSEDHDQATTIGHFGAEDTHTMLDEAPAANSEAPAGAAAEPMPAESHEASSNAAAITMPETTPDSIATETPATNDDEAIAKMSTPETDTTEALTEGGAAPATEPVSESATTAEAADEPSVIIPTTSFKPDHERVQPVKSEKDEPEIDEEEQEEDENDSAVIETDKSADADSGIVMADHHDGEHKTEDTTPEMPIAPPIAPEGETTTSPEDSDDKIEAAMAELGKAIEILQEEKAKLSDAFAQHEHDESEAREAKENTKAKLDDVDSKLVQFASLKDAAQQTFYFRQ